MSRPRKKITKVILVMFLILGLSLVGVIVFPNPLGNHILSEAKAYGYLEYEPEEAYALAMKVCTQCHTTERIKLYCPRCGPPFVAVVPHMQTFIDNYKITKPNLEFYSITEPQAVAIVQVWNALVGNWESDFREQDILKLIGHYDNLKALYLTPVEKRKIEYALLNRDDLKIGHMSNLEDMQKNLGKPENNQQETGGQQMEHDHSNHKGHGEQQSHEGHMH